MKPKSYVRENHLQKSLFHECSNNASILSMHVKPPWGKKMYDVDFIFLMNNKPVIS